MNAQLKDKLLAWEFWGNWFMMGLVCLWIFIIPSQWYGATLNIVTVAALLIVQQIERRMYYSKLVREE